MPKICLFGAGSGFTLPLCADLLRIEGLDEGVIALVDIDAKRLDLAVKLIRRLVEVTGKTKWRVEGSTDRRKVLRGTDYIFIVIEVAGLQCVAFENDIPMRYGIDQCVGDTIGPGGIMKALRTFPAFQGILEDAQRLCPKAMILNHTNPMSIMTLGAVRSTSQPFAGLCHSVQGNSRGIASIIGVPYDDLEWQCGGINHMAWFTTLRWQGQDMHPVLRAAAERDEVFKSCRVRMDLVRNIGYFSTESCGHFSEYVPYYRKRKDLIKKFCPGTTRAYGNDWGAWRRGRDKMHEAMAAGKQPIPTLRSMEYTTDIVEAHLFDRKKVVYCSVPNTGLIPNLPQTGVVEVPTLVDRRGLMPTYFGNLPEPCAALCRANMGVFEMCVQGLLNHDREAIIQAMMLDPLSAAVCSLGEIRAMAEELFAAEKGYIPAWCSQPKKAVLPRGRMPLTPFVLNLSVSRILPQENVATLSYPEDREALELKRKKFKGFCNRHEELEKAGAGLVFFASRIRCGSQMHLQARLGYDGPVKVWIDGREAFCDPHGTNPVVTDAASIPFTAAKGEHEIMVALDTNGGQAWGIALRYERLGLPMRVAAGNVRPVNLPQLI